MHAHGVQARGSPAGRDRTGGRRARPRSPHGAARRTARAAGARAATRGGSRPSTCASAARMRAARYARRARRAARAPARPGHGMGQLEAHVHARGARSSTPCAHLQRDQLRQVRADAARHHLLGRQRRRHGRRAAVGRLPVRVRGRGAGRRLVRLPILREEALGELVLHRAEDHVAPLLVGLALLLERRAPRALERVRERGRGDQVLRAQHQQRAGVAREHGAPVHAMPCACHAHTHEGLRTRTRARGAGSSAAARRRWVYGMLEHAPHAVCTCASLMCMACAWRTAGGPRRRSRSR